MIRAVVCEPTYRRRMASISLRNIDLNILIERVGSLVAHVL